MPNLAQVWALPCLDLTETVELASGISMKVVLAQPQNRPTFNALLLQTPTSNMNEAPSDFRRIGQILSRLSFSLLCQFHVFSARVIPTGLKEGDSFDELLFAGPPPGIALFEHKLGFNPVRRFDGAILGSDLPPNVERAISWFMLGNQASNSVQQVLCHWIGLETLAPTVTGPWQCAECGCDVTTCPHCKHGTNGPKTVRSIRTYVEGTLGVTRKEYNSLYKLRNIITHGDLAMDPDGISKAAEKACRIQDLLLCGIKIALGWPLELAPLIEQRGLNIVGVPGLIAQATVMGASYYDVPRVYPA